MFVFYDPVPVSRDPDRFRIIYTAAGDREELTAGRSDWIEVPSALESLAGVFVENGALVVDPLDATYRIELAARVDAERDRRMKSGFPYLGAMYDFDDVSKSRITGMATLAGFALGQGALPGNLFWHGGQQPFVWVAQDNSFVPMDAPTCFGLGKAAATHEMTYIFAARALKDAPAIPTDYANDAYWP